MRWTGYVENVYEDFVFLAFTRFWYMEIDSLEAILSDKIYRNKIWGLEELRLRYLVQYIYVNNVLHTNVFLMFPTNFKIMPYFLYIFIPMLC